MGTRRVALQNLDRAMLRWRQPQLWRSPEESRAIKRLVWLWFNHDGPGQTRPSIHSIARTLGVSRFYVQKLIRRWERDPAPMERVERQLRPVTIADLERARETTRRMRERGMLRS
jgi:hypothetical protein